MNKPHAIINESYGSFRWLMREVGRDRELTPDPNTWDHSQFQWIDSIVQSGVNNFYFPTTDMMSASREDQEEETKDDRRRMPHTWSFLQMMGTIAVEAEKTAYQLPDDYVGIQGDFVLESGNGRIPVVPEAQLRQLSAKNTNTGTPAYAAIRARKTPEGQRYDLILYPKPKSAEEMTYRYTVAADDISDDNPYPYGGRQHAETILASCLAVAEERSPNPPESRPKYRNFITRLAASIHLDKQSKPAAEMVWTSSDDQDGNTLTSLVGEYAGFGQHPDGWTKAQTEQVKEIMRQAIRRFHMPAAIPGRRDQHVWSFLYPLARLELTSGQSSYDLPADFGGLDSPMTYVADENTIYPAIQIVGEHQIRMMLQQTMQSTGRPVKAGFTQKRGGNLSPGGSYELKVWPVPSGNYVLDYRYRVQPSNDLTIIHGIEAHFDTILMACRAQADIMLKRKQRRHEELYQERLIASVLYDQQLKAPRAMGYNRDSSVNQNNSCGEFRYGWAEENNSGIPYNGQYYD